jgi:hypothetical protein
MSDTGDLRPIAVDAAQLHGRPLRYFDFVMAAFVVILLLSNIVGAEKRSVIDLPIIGPGRSARASCSSRSPTCSMTC